MSRPFRAEMATVTPGFEDVGNSTEGAIVRVLNLTIVAEEVLMQRIRRVSGLLQKAERDAAIVVDVRVERHTGAAVKGFQFGFEQSVLDAGSAQEPPGLCGEPIDEEFFLRIAGLPRGEEPGAEVLIFGVGFKGQGRGDGGESVTDGVPTGDTFARRGTRSGGFLRIVQIGQALAFGNIFGSFV